MREAGIRRKLWLVVVSHWTWRVFLHARKGNTTELHTNTHLSSSKHAVYTEEDRCTLYTACLGKLSTFYCFDRMNDSCMYQQDYTALRQ